jgi:glycosyltransferase involved in cell wall biosynthesis
MDLQNTSPVTLKLLRLRKRFVYGLATGLVANSAAALQDLQSGYGVPSSKCAVQHLGVADPRQRLPLVPVEAREDTVLCVGRLHPSKGQDILIDAISKLGPSANGTRFHFLGNGPALEDLRRRAVEKDVAGRCVFAGTMKHEEVVSRMSQAKAVVAPSRSEAFGLVNVEAISVATPVVASCVGGIPEIVRDGVEGLLFAPGDSASLAGKLATLLSDIELRKRLGSNGRDRFLRAFELKQRVRDHANFLESLSL